MKILWHSNAPWSSTGYGQQTATFTPLLNAHYDVTISSFYGLDGAPLKWHDITVLPGIGGDFGNLALVPHATDVFGGDPRGGLVLSLMDVWVLDTAVCSQLNLACWVPVDHDPTPPAVAEFFPATGATPIAMSRFGQQQLDCELYVPHGIDTDTYRPFGREKIRETWGIPNDAFVVGIFAANKGRPSRKAFSESLQALKPFMDEHENAYLYLHTMLNPAYAAGEDLNALIEDLGIPKDRVGASGQYATMFQPYPAEMMACLYSGLDVLLNPAHGEGFGITPLEAQACGVPVIVGDNTAQREVAGAGWHVEGRRFWTGQKSWQFMPSVEGIHDALEDCYTLPESQRAALSRDARAHAERYDRAVVFVEHMLPAVRSIEAKLDRVRPVTIPARVAA